jgi:hypothetical protein
MWAKNKIVDYVYYTFCQHTENIITNYLEYMDAPVHKITNVPLIPIVCNAFLYAGKTQIGDFSVFFERASTFFAALKKVMAPSKNTSTFPITVCVLSAYKNNFPHK